MNILTIQEFNRSEAGDQLYSEILKNGASSNLLQFCDGGPSSIPIRSDFSFTKPGNRLSYIVSIWHSKAMNCKTYSIRSNMKLGKCDPRFINVESDDKNYIVKLLMKLLR